MVGLTVTDDDGASGAASTSVAVTNVAPQLAQLHATPITENGVTTLTGRIVDPGTLDTFTLAVTWGDTRSPHNAETYTFAAGTTDFALSHQYLDDNAADAYTIGFGVTDDDGGNSS